MKKQVAVLYLGLAFGSVVVPAETNTATPGGKPVENLTLEQALEMAENRQPQIAEAKAMIEAAEGRARQAGAFPNPEAILGAQQLPLSGNQPNEKEYVAGVGQTIPLSRRLSTAREAELLDREMRARGLEVKRREIRKQVHNAFATALYQEKSWQAQSEFHQNSARAVALTRVRVEAGDTVKDDLARAEMELARTRIELQRAELLREQSLVGLASAIGDATLTLKSLAGTLGATFEIPTLESLAANLSANPAMLHADASVRASEARVSLAKAERIPDVKVELLYHRLEASSADTFDVGLSIPLPVFNRNQGKLREARAEQAAAEARARMTQNELTARLRESHVRLNATLANRRTWEDEILARAESVLRSAEIRYAAGDISLAEVLPARRDWAAAQLSYLESLREVMQAWAEVKSFQ
jgi:cobalt-zinc-cadmium efflux system outer membrane protein